MTYSHKLSVVIPIHDMPNGDFFLWRSINALMAQTFQDFEIIITKAGKMAENTNAGILKAKGELIKILYLDDYLAHDRALERIVDTFQEDTEWLVTGCLHQEGAGEIVNPHYPEYTNDIETGNNRIGSPSVLTIRNNSPKLFDSKLSWLLDCDLYKRYNEAYGAPRILNDLNVVIGLHPGQTTHVLTDQEKSDEHNYLLSKFK